MSQSPDLILPSAKKIGLKEPDFRGYFRNRTYCSHLPGAYVVWLYLACQTRVEKPANARLPSGWYLYAGSAYGPGGLRARLSRHLAKNKTRRWHIDYLTSKATRRYGWAWINAKECELVATLQDHPDFHHVIPGFGSSDCAHCPSHLLAWHP